MMTKNLFYLLCDYIHKFEFKTQSLENEEKINKCSNKLFDRMWIVPE